MFRKYSELENFPEIESIIPYSILGENYCPYMRFLHRTLGELSAKRIQKNQQNPVTNEDLYTELVPIDYIQLQIVLQNTEVVPKPLPLFDYFEIISREELPTILHENTKIEQVEIQKVEPEKDLKERNNAPENNAQKQPEKDILENAAQIITNTTQDQVQPPSVKQSIETLEQFLKRIGILEQCYEIFIKEDITSVDDLRLLTVEHMSAMKIKMKYIAIITKELEK